MSYPLLMRLPGTSGMPRLALCDLPTPLEPLELDTRARMLRVKRDDASARAYGGNKARKLELLLGEALAQKRRAVITFGAYGSNHALATAVHASAAGIEPHVVLSPQAPGPFAARTLRAHAGLGTHIHAIEGWDGSREAVRVRRELAERDGVEPYVIPMGGTNALGAIAYVNAALELAAQAQATGEGLPDRVYLAGGTIGTAIGLAIGFSLLEAPTRVEAVRVTPGEVCNLESARTLTIATVDRLRSLDSGMPDVAFEDLRFALREEFFEPGYGVPTTQSVEAVRVATEAGIPAETTYTGKALAALLADSVSGALDDADVLFWDTYNSSPLPPAGRDEDLPGVLQEYVVECDRLFASEKGPTT
ncbi:MAG: pyridoxal-phosphate dependent enzyme [Coriobacteriia bacterium]|nr:pyridoxal-phosphate dependent enzyme [Coriobacteriia bacterium]